MADAWPMIAKCKQAQWNGLGVVEQAAASDYWDSGRGYVNGYLGTNHEDAFVIWSIDRIPLMSVKYH